FTNSSNNVGGLNNTATLYALTVTVNDTTNSTSSSALPFDVIVANNFASTNVSALDSNTTTPTIVYSLNGNSRAITASGVSADVWFIDAGNKATFTGGTGVNRYLIASQAESPEGGNADTI